MTPTEAATDEGVVPNQYSLEIYYKPGMPPQRFHGVHIPDSLVESMHDKKLQSFHMVTLEHLSAAAYAMPNRPSYVVLAVELADGKEIADVPDAWLKIKRRGLCVGALLVALATAAAISEINPALSLVAGLMMAIGAVTIERARRVHTTPFLVTEGWTK